MIVTGENGFLAGELIPHLKQDDGVVLLMGCPTFDGDTIPKLVSISLHAYVKEVIEIIDEYIDSYIVFFSSTGVTDIDFNHKGCMSYSIAKLYIENYIVTHCSNYLILRVGTIISTDIDKVKKMKPTRIQQRVMRGELKGIELKDNYLMLDNFIRETVDAIENRVTGIYEYDLTELRLSDLMRITK